MRPEESTAHSLQSYLHFCSGAEWNHQENSLEFEHRGRYRLPKLADSISWLFPALAGKECDFGVQEAELKKGQAGLQEQPKQDELDSILEELEDFGFLSRSLVHDGKVVLTLEPNRNSNGTQSKHPRGENWDPEKPLYWSRFAFLRPNGGSSGGKDGHVMVLESPLCRDRAKILDPEILTLLHQIAQGVTLCRPKGMDEVMRQLLSVGLLSHQAPDFADESWNWEFHDLLFHDRSRYAQRDESFGGVFPFGETGDEDQRLQRPSAKKRSVGASVVALPQVSNEEEHIPTVFEAFQIRKSTRAYLDRPLALSRLSDWLWHAHRVMGVREGVGGKQFFQRAYPSGGASYEIEVYLLVRKVDGAQPGLYRYDPHEHQLEAYAEANPMLDRLALLTAGAALLQEPPPVVVYFTSRLGRISWKYRGISYALTLKHLGTVLQTSYLTAAALKLGTTAIGSGDSHLFAKASGVDPFEEPLVGEMLLGEAAQP